MNNDYVFKKFEYYFKKSLFDFKDIQIAFFYKVIFCFDIIKFDEYFIKNIYDYEKENISLKDAILKKFGEEAVEIIEFLLKNCLDFNHNWVNLKHK
ncbi:MAG: hypothetical protein GYA62_08870 [Bacteroidales bacterium]|nr:hypothetical protein [Bacteroidales bacterium]